MNPAETGSYVPVPAQIVGRTQETLTVFTLQLRIADETRRAAYRFSPGQFNMVSLPGVGEVPISISSDPEDAHALAHTIRAVGRVTNGMAALAEGDWVGLRGPFGRGWPLDHVEGRDVVVATGGLGCAPVVSVIDYIQRRRERFGKLVIIEGVKHSRDLIYRDRFAEWDKHPNNQVLIAATVGEASWPWHVGPVSDLFQRAEFDPGRAVAMMCGPEGMMIAAAKAFLDRGMPLEEIFLSMERNMQCAQGLCGHCQFGPRFVCRDGPVFSYAEVRDLLGRKGY
jgi:sulfhydrogenase subunit gamma (sulfur reductase)